MEFQTNIFNLTAGRVNGMVTVSFLIPGLQYIATHQGNPIVTQTKSRDFNVRFLQLMNFLGNFHKHK